MKLILGSGSKSRQGVLKDAGYDFDVLTADIDEKAIRDPDPKKLVLLLAHAKADAIVPKVKESALLITADQVVVCGGMIREKPVNAEEAREFIRGYRTNPMETVSSIVVTNTQTGNRAEGVEIAKVYFKPIPDNVIEEAIALGRIMGCAGAMRCEEKPFSDYIEKMEGTHDSTSGLPLNLLKRLINDVSGEIVS